MSSEHLSQWDYQRGGHRGEKEPYRRSPTTSKQDEEPLKISDRLPTTRTSPIKQKTWPPRPREERDFTKLSIDKTQIMAILKACPGARKLYTREVYRIKPKKLKRNPSPIISFSDKDYGDRIIEDHQDALVITTKVETNTVQKILVDNGSFVDILYYSAFKRMDLGDRKLNDARDAPPYGFTGNEVHVVGVIDLPVLFGSPPCQTWKMVKFHVINAIISYNAIIGRTTLGSLKTKISIPHLKMKFITDFGVGEMSGDQKTSRQCYKLSNSEKALATETSINQIVKVDPRDIIELPKPSTYEPVELVEDIPQDDKELDKTIKIGIKISQELRAALPGIKAVKQKRRFFQKKQEAIEKKVDRLLEAGFIKPVQFPRWIANIVLVKKSNDKWHMCIDYSDLNKACPKDFYLLPNINQLIDATTENKILSFMDTFSGYNQIKLAEEDQDDTAFITHKGVFTYKVVPFRLLTAGATFQRTMNTVFEPQIIKNVQVYADDIVTMSPTASAHVNDLRETFERVRNYNMRLNPAKCSFALSGGRFLGFLLTQRGIEADPNQISAIQNMTASKCLKELQILAGSIVALRCFIPQSSKKCLPIYEAIKQASKSNPFIWTKECEESL
ncbi:uncharacterized protein LOC141696691 [Apium graveolens]|uniref:uncharacterized protein LOC141696691 n=1 Tax=Apium graveolens TaxID=4045 RepID=UPI003D7B26FC